MLEQWFGFLLENLLFFILHVTPTGGFPKALTAAKERECLRLLAEGDAAARDTLIEHNLRLVAHVAKKYYATGVDPDDLVSIGTVGLIKAVSTFDGTKAVRFATYASRCIENEILMYFRSRKKTAFDVSINEPIDTDKDGNTLTLMDVIACEDNIVENLDTSMKLAKLRDYLARLEERERTVLRLRYGLNGFRPLTQREVAAKLNISRSYVSRIEKKALLDLRAMFGE